MSPDMSTTGLAEELIRAGRAAGLDAVGVCGAEPFLAERAILEARRAAGLSAGMQFTYRNPVRSTDPNAALEGARSLVVGARRYLRAAPAPAGPPGSGPAGSGPPGSGPTGSGLPASGSGGARGVPVPSSPEARVARYSWIDHYAPLRRALDSVAATLVEHGWRARVLADDNALVDRAAAVRAGLGWYGNNANVLLPGAGSWFVLGSVVTDAALVDGDRPAAAGPPPGGAAPAPGRVSRAIPPGYGPEPAWGCGSCRRCLTACPTGALVEPGVLDARRCLAWLLQAPGAFPREHREALGDRLYGCDECQEVCPVNKLAVRGDPPAPAEVGSQAHLRVLDLLAGSDDELLRLVGRWYIPGREARYVRRNALVVLGNSGRGDDPAVVGAVRAALGHPDGIVRAHAVWAARRLGLRGLLDVVAADTDPLVEEELRAGEPSRSGGAVG